ncbi:hypothetical protein ABLN87_13025 [Ruegeria sp. SCPT10]|uniref:hypothetical protein n=1 Tax=Ruegeria sp. SCP10 TaxID=3141377 RepID=UPI003334FC31
MKIDHDYLQKLELEIAERVHSDVERRLFRKYLYMGTFVGAVLGVFGWSVVDTVRDQAADLATDAAQPAIEQAERVIEDATRAASDARYAAEAAAVRLQSIDEYLERREQILREVRSDTRAQRRLAEEMQEETEIFFQATREKSEELDVSRQNLADEFQKLNNNLSDYQTRTEQFGVELNRLASAGDLETVARSVDTLGAQLAAMNKQLLELTQKASTTEALVQQGADGAAIQEAVTEVASETLGSLATTTVYFQFAGSTRELAEAISERLKAESYILPGEERTSIAAGKHEVRFFFPEDFDQAQKLVEDVNSILLSMGLQANVSVSDFTDFQRAKPRRNTLELWLEPIAL